MASAAVKEKRKPNSRLGDGPPLYRPPCARLAPPPRAWPGSSGPPTNTMSVKVGPDDRAMTLGASNFPTDWSGAGQPISVAAIPANDPRREKGFAGQIEPQVGMMEAISVGQRHATTYDVN